MSDEAILKMPIARFWLFSESVDRLNAADDLRAISVANSVGSSESLKKKVSELAATLGNVVVKDFLRDKEGIDKLKRMLLR